MDEADLKIETKPSETRASVTTKRSKLRWVLRQSRRQFISLAVLLLLFILVFGTYAWLVNDKADRQLHRVRHEIKKRGLMEIYPDYLESIGPWTTDHSGTAAAYWRAAMQARPDAGDLPLPVVGRVNIIDVEERQRFHPDAIVAMREVVAKHPEFFRLVEAARNADQPGAFQTDRDTNIFTQDLDLMGNVRSVARWNLLRATLAQAEGDGEAFTDAMLAILDLNQVFAEEHGILAMFVGISVDAMARRGVIEGLGRLELTAKQLDRLIGAFQERIDSYDTTKIVGYEISKDFYRIGLDTKTFIRFGEARRDTLLQRIEQNDDDLFKLSDPGGPLERYWDHLLLTYAWGRYELRYVETVDLALANYDMLKQLDGKPKQRWAWLSQQEDEFKDEDHAFDDYRSMRTLYFITALRTADRARSILSAGVAALQAEKYRVVHGNWPDRLIDATRQPAFDAYGETLRYRKTQEGIIVYTVGANTIDEQGYGQESETRPSQFRKADDWGSILYDPELRNAIPPPESAIRDYDDWTAFERELYDKPETED